MLALEVEMLAAGEEMLSAREEMLALREEMLAAREEIFALWKEMATAREEMFPEWMGPIQRRGARSSVQEAVPLSPHRHAAKSFARPRPAS